MAIPEDHKLFFDVIYSEASKGDDFDKDALGVANVIKNRTLNPEKFGASILDVLLTPNQFSSLGGPDFEKAQTMKFSPDEEELYKKAIHIGSCVMRGTVEDPTQGADHYVGAKSTKPPWAKKMKKTFSSASHVFLKE